MPVWIKSLPIITPSVFVDTAGAIIMVIAVRVFSANAVHAFIGKDLEVFITVTKRERFPSKGNWWVS